MLGLLKLQFALPALRLEQMKVKNLFYESCGRVNDKETEL